MNAARSSIVVVDEAVRDEGTSLHYLPPSSSVDTPSPRLVDAMVRELTALRVPVSSGQCGRPMPRTVKRPIGCGAGLSGGACGGDAGRLTLRVRSGPRRKAGMVALVSNGVDQTDAGFDTGGHEFRRQILAAVARATIH